MGSFNDINYQIALRREILVCVQYTENNQFPIWKAFDIKQPDFKHTSTRWNLSPFISF